MIVRQYYLILSALGILSLVVVPQFWAPYAWAALLIVPYIVVGCYDLFFSHNNVLRNYPVIGHLRYGMEFISPEIRQYFIETEHSGRPFNREQREMVYRRAEGKPDFQPFGTQYDIEDVGYRTASHSLNPKVVPESEARVDVGGPECKQVYNASRLNISAMSFGALSPNAIEALNKGAKLGNFAHNTGEGGLSRYHLAGGGDIVWQIGTGYFGCRTKDGHFDLPMFSDNAARPAVKMIEIKLSQGAKPSHGGVLPAAKVNEEIAAARGVPMGEDCISPPTHSTFSNPRGLLEFVALLREHSGGKPTGFKLCIGRKSEFMGICKAMLETGITPDFITIDGAEGGTGAAPLEFSDRLGMKADEGLMFTHSCLLGIDKRAVIRLISSGKIVTGFDIVQKIAIGADLCNAARTMLFAIGCIQAVRCNTNTCPSGVATQDRQRMRAVVVDERKHGVANYHAENIKSFLDLTGAIGLSSPDELTPRHIMRRTGDEVDRTYEELYPFLHRGQLLDGSEIHPQYARFWEAASADRF